MVPDGVAKGSRELVECAPGLYRFQLDVAPKAGASVPVEEVRVLQASYQLASLEDECDKANNNLADMIDNLQLDATI